jgi:hypothetical protein
VLHVVDPIVAVDDNGGYWFDIGSTKLLYLRAEALMSETDRWDFSRSKSADSKDLAETYLHAGSLPMPFPSTEFDVSWHAQVEGVVLRIEVLGAHLPPARRVREAPDPGEREFLVLDMSLGDLDSSRPRAAD